MTWVEGALLLLLLACGVGMSVSRSMLTAILLFGAYGLAMTLLWLFLQAPDLAVTEAAVGVGATGILYYIVLRRTRWGKGGKKNGAP